MYFLCVFLEENYQPLIVEEFEEIIMSSDDGSLKHTKSPISYLSVSAV